MIGFFKKNSRALLFTGVILLCILLICMMLVLLLRYSEGIEDQAVSRVENYSSDTAILLTQKIDTISRNVHHAAERISGCSNTSALALMVQEILKVSDYSSVVDVRFFKGNTEYNLYGFPQEFDEAEEVRAVAGKKGAGVAGIVYDYEHNLQTVAFYAAVENNPLVDTVIFFYPISELSSAFDAADEDKLDKADFVALCARNGEVISVLTNPAGDLNKHSNIFEYVRTNINNKGMVDEMNMHIEEGEHVVYAMNIGETSYVISLGTSETANGIFLIGLYRAEKAYTVGYQIINTILSAMIIVFVILIFLLIYTMGTNRRAKRKIKELSHRHPTLGCLTVLGFKTRANEIFKKHRATKFAVVAAEIRYFNYISETYGESAAENLLKYLSVVCTKNTGLDELYGYYADGQFFLLLHYKDQRDMLERIARIYSTLRRYPLLKNEGFTVKLTFGINEITPPCDTSIDILIDQAIVAKTKTSESGTDQHIKFYDESMRQAYLQKADIETRADKGLENEEFAVFYQPKYNVAKNCVESAEALIRWYDPEQKFYRSPGEFLPIFEANGFIVKLDHYVYEKVCRYISESIERNQFVLPISVNISRVTAVQPDFIEIYSNMKHRYHIPDDILILEFTESFADENYERLERTITALHRNGFICSIDDFGSGYSSFNILKQVQMDELKFDSLFIKKGLSSERDRLILGQMIKIAKSLGMRIVQEGVETFEDFNMLKQLGCDVVQGYYYSKPLTLIDYLLFIEEHREK